LATDVLHGFERPLCRWAQGSLIITERARGQGATFGLTQLSKKKEEKRGLNQKPRSENAKAAI